MLKLLTIFIIFLGEALAIYAELAGARQYFHNPSFLSMAILKLFLFVTLGIWVLFGGYILGYTAFKNIWIVSAISITSILIIEPILNYTIFQQLPTRGALVGLIFGALGFAAALFY